MNRTQITSLIRHGISGLAGVLLAHGLGNQQIYSEISALVVSLLCVVWSIKDKDKPVLMIEGALRQLASTATALGAVLAPEKIDAYIAVAVYIANLTLGQTDKVDREEQVETIAEIKAQVNNSFPDAP